MKKATETPIRQTIRYVADDFRVLVSDGRVKPQKKAFHEALEIKCFYEGRSMVMIDSEVIAAEAGDITIVNPYEIHTNVITDAYEGKYYLMMVDPDFFSDTGIGNVDLRQLLFGKGHRFNHHVKNNARLQRIILRVKEELDQKKPYYRQIVANLLGEFFMLLLREELAPKTSPALNGIDVRKSNLIAPALMKIFQSFDSKLTVEELAKLCNVSKYHFCRVFKEQMGASVTQYIIRYRISVAESMLKDEKQSVKEVAEFCGFDDISYFYRCYKKIKGASPNKSRRP